MSRLYRARITIDPHVWAEFCTHSNSLLDTAPDTELATTISAESLRTLSLSGLDAPNGEAEALSMLQEAAAAGWLSTSSAADLDDLAGQGRLDLSGRDALSGMLEEAATSLETNLATDVFSNVLHSLDFQVDAAQGDGSSAVHGRRGDTEVLVVSSAGGIVDLDVSGLGESCGTLVGEMQEALAQRGAEAQILELVAHGREEGGDLLTSAYQANPDCPAQGAVTRASQEVRARAQRRVRSRSRMV